jgi:zinc resistance-associated protein
MLKSAIAAIAILTVASHSTLNAQMSGPSGGDGGARLEEQHYLFSTKDLEAFTDARIAGLKAGLQLTQEQERNWPAFEQALRDLAKLRIERIRTREAGAQQQPSSNPFDRLQRLADSMSTLATALKHVADAGTPLYQSLSDDQKNRFTFLARMLHWPGRGFEGHRHGMGRDGWDSGGAKGMSPDTDEDDL